MNVLAGELLLGAVGHFVVAPLASRVESAIIARNKGSYNEDAVRHSILSALSIVQEDTAALRVANFKTAVDDLQSWLDTDFDIRDRFVVEAAFLREDILSHSEWNAGRGHSLYSFNINMFNAPFPPNQICMLQTPPFIPTTFSFLCPISPANLEKLKSTISNASLAMQLVPDPLDKVISQVPMSKRAMIQLSLLPCF